MVRDHCSTVIFYIKFSLRIDSFFQIFVRKDKFEVFLLFS